MRNKLILLVFLLLGVRQIQAQQATFLSQSELGISVGQVYYIGDLNPFMPFKNSQWALV